MEDLLYQEDEAEDRDQPLVEQDVGVSLKTGQIFHGEARLLRPVALAHERLEHDGEGPPLGAVDVEMLASLVHDLVGTVRGGVGRFHPRDLRYL